MTTADSDRQRFTSPDQRVSRKNQKRLTWFTTGISLLMLLLFIGFPLYWMFASSIRPPTSLFSTPPSLFPEQPTLANFAQLFEQTRFWTYFKNSLIVGIGATVVTTILATLGGYGLARADFRGKRNLARSVLFAYMFPALLIAIPLYRLFYRTNMLNSYVSLTLAHTAVSLPFCTWLMWQFFQTIPRSYEESAWINGAGLTRTLVEVVMPMARPGIIAVAIFAFSFSWNDFTFATILMTEQNMLTIPVGVNGFVEQTAIHWGLVQSAGVLIVLPPLLIILFLQRYLLVGFGVSEL